MTQFDILLNSTLILMILVIFKILFSKFGHENKEELEKRNKAIEVFMNAYNKNNNITGGKYFLLDRTIGEKNLDEMKEKIKNEIAINDELVNEIAIKNEELNEKEFLNTCEKAVTKVYDLINEQKIDELRDFCTNDMLNLLSNNINKLIKDHYTMKASIISFTKKDIVDKEKNKVVVNIATNQINYITDKDNNVISGYKDKIQTVSENWEFVQVNDKLNIWLLNNITETF